MEEIGIKLWRIIEELVAVLQEVIMEFVLVPIWKLIQYPVVREIVEMIVIFNGFTRNLLQKQNT